MPSGGRRMVINTQERAVSTDINRLQQFLGKDRAELWRYLIDVSANTDDLDAGAVSTEYTTQETPLRGEILNGLTVQPQIGSFNLLIAPGVAFVIDPDAVPSTDDSSYKLVRDAGVQTLGALTMSGNVSGSIRIDVIECQRTEAIVETDNRDIFNPITGLFAATTVTKGTQSQFTYRVRQGTPGGGMPAAAAGWMILAVASVPNGATSNDQITFWDVRPLVNDRIFAPLNLSLSLSKELRSRAKAVFITPHTVLSGVVERTLGTRRLGGRIRPGVPLTDANSINVDDAANIGSGQTPVLNSFWFLYFCTPFGLPRWARYTDSSSGSRIPRSPRGIPVVSNVPPNQDGSPTGVIALPTSTGLGGSAAVTEAILAIASRTDGSATPVGVQLDGIQQTTQTGHPQIAGTALGLGTATFVLVDNTHYPANAKAIHGSIVFVDSAAGFTANSNGYYSNIVLTLQDSAGHNQAQIEFGAINYANASASTAAGTFAMRVRIPIVGDYPTITPGTRNVVLSWAGGTGTPSSVILKIDGWEM